MRGQRNNEYEQSFDDAILVVIDQLETSNPSELVGYVLRDQGKLERFLRLAAALNKLVDLIGPHGTFEDALSTGEPWAECVAAARSLRALLRS